MSVAPDPDPRPPMRRHEPEGYTCPFCRMLSGGPPDAEGAPTRSDLVAETAHAVAFVSPRWWPRNPGHVIVIPRTHVENLYTMSVLDGHALQDLVQTIAVVMRNAYGCEGISTRQHNEPAGGQDVWHLHTHVFPRWSGDDLYTTSPSEKFALPRDRSARATILRDEYLRLGA